MSQGIKHSSVPRSSKREECVVAGWACERLKQSGTAKIKNGGTKIWRSSKIGLLMAFVVLMLAFSFDKVD